MAGAAGGSVNIVASCRMRFVITDMSAGIPHAGEIGGHGDFVDQILSESKEALERRHALKARGLDINSIAKRVSGLLHMDEDEVWLPGRYERQVTARSLVCFWAVRELGFSMASLARRFNISDVAVSKSVRRGAKIAKSEGYELI